MIELLLSDRMMIVGDFKGCNRPGTWYGSSRLYVILDDFNHNWLIKNNISYKICEKIVEKTYYSYYIVFENKSDAMLFKLTWL